MSLTIKQKEMPSEFIRVEDIRPGHFIMSQCGIKSMRFDKFIGYFDGRSCPIKDSILYYKDLGPWIIEE